MKLSTPPTPPWKQNYLLHFETALILILATFIGLFKLNLPDSNNSLAFNFPEGEILRLEGIVATIHPTDKPVPPPVVPLPNPPPRDEIIEEQLRNLDIEFLVPDPIPLPRKAQNTLRENNRDNLNTIPMVTLPELIGGREKLQRNIKYPHSAVEDEVEGRVIVEFLVDEKGKVRNPKVIKGVRDDINQEALRAISKAQFIPAREKGKTIPVEQVLFIMFKLDNNS